MVAGIASLGVSNVKQRARRRNLKRQALSHQTLATDPATHLCVYCLREPSEVLFVGQCRVSLQLLLRQLVLHNLRVGHESECRQEPSIKRLRPSIVSIPQGKDTKQAQSITPNRDK